MHTLLLIPVLVAKMELQDQVPLDGLTSQGRYELTTFDDRKGAVQASHRVAIRTMIAEEDSDERVKIVRTELLAR